jgi:hypothetical protein
MTSTELKGSVHVPCDPHSITSYSPSPTPSEGIPQFSLFHKLPVELRFKIWEEALVIERVLTLRSHFDFSTNWTEELFYFEGKERSPASLCSCGDSFVVFTKFHTYSCANHQHRGCYNQKFFIDGSRDILYLRNFSPKTDISSLHYALATDVIHPTATKIKTLAFDFRTDSFHEVDALALVPYFFRHLELVIIIMGNINKGVTEQSHFFGLKVTRIIKRGPKKGLFELDWSELRREQGKACNVSPIDIRQGVLEIFRSLDRSFTYFEERWPGWIRPKFQFMGVRSGKEGDRA